MRIALVMALVLDLGLAREAVAAQWGVSAELGVAHFAGSSRDSSGTVVGPYRPTTVSVALDRRMGALAVAIAAMYAKTGIAGERGGLAVVQYDLASLWEFAPEVSLRLLRFGAGVEARVAAGPAIESWKVNDQRRSRIAGRARVAIAWPLAGGFSGSLSVSGALTGSVFDPSDVPAGVERQSTRRLGVAVGLRYQL